MGSGPYLVTVWVVEWAVVEQAHLLCNYTLQKTEPGVLPLYESGGGLGEGAGGVPSPVVRVQRQLL